MAGKDWQQVGARAFTSMTQNLVEPHPAIPTTVRMSLACPHECCLGEMAAGTLESFKHLIKLLGAIICPRAAIPLHGDSPLLCFNKDPSAPGEDAGVNLFILGSSSARKNPLVAELCMCKGPQGVLAPPFDVEKDFGDLGGHRVLAVRSEACVARLVAQAFPPGADGQLGFQIHLCSYTLKSFRVHAVTSCELYDSVAALARIAEQQLTSRGMKSFRDMIKKPKPTGP